MPVDHRQELEVHGLRTVDVRLQLEGPCDVGQRVVELQLPGVQRGKPDELVRILLGRVFGRILLGLDGLDGEPLQALVVLGEVDGRGGRRQTKPAQQ